MKTGPDIASVATLIGDPARANMLTALMDGVALTAGELARHAGVTAQTASSHLSRLVGGNLLTVRRQGRHAYYALADRDVASVLEALMGLAARAGHDRTRTGPREPELRAARVCYDHLAGDRGVQLFDYMLRSDMIVEAKGTVTLTPKGRRFAEQFGIDLDAIARQKRPLCRPCLDWSVRRSHLAGALGAAMLDRILARKWARRIGGTRIVAFTPRGRTAFDATFR